MELIKDKWNKSDIKEFNKYLESIQNEDKREWSRNLLKTNLPCLAIKTAEIKKIAKEISKGNFLSFLDLMIWDYYDNTAINGILISSIDDFKTMKKYLDIYSPKADNWATCDLLTFKMKDNEENYIKLCEEYIKSDKPFVRRIGIEPLFRMVDNEKYVPKIFEILDKFEKEKEYYVNMINAWLLCDLFIKRREETIKFLNKNKLNKFTTNKMISKCRDSFRVSKEDKEMLLKYKK